MKNKNLNLKKMKQIIQKILDKYLPPEDRFSVKNFGYEEIRYLCRILLEKDDKKREKIWKEIEDRVKQLKYECDTDFNEIEKYKELFDNKTDVFDETVDLLNDIEIESELNSELDNI